MVDSQQPCHHFVAAPTFQVERVILRHPTGAVVGLVVLGLIHGQVLHVAARLFTRNPDGSPGPWTSECWSKQFQVQGEPQAIFDLAVAEVLKPATIASVEHLAGKPGWKGYEGVQ